MRKKAILPLLLGSLLLLVACGAPKDDVAGAAGTPLPAPCPTVQTQEGEGERIVRMQLEEGTVLISLEDNATADALLAQLPCTMTFEDYAHA